MVVMTRRLFIVLIACLGAGCGKDDSKPSAPVQLKPAPKITAMVPDTVTPRGYRTGMIDGEGFDTTKRVKVFFGTTPSPRAAVVAKNKVQTEVPPGKDGTEVEVRVEIEGYEPAVAPVKLKYDEGREDPDHDEHGEAGSQQ
jgi:IPT/TIG domain-containing protein